MARASQQLPFGFLCLGLCITSLALHNIKGVTFTHELLYIYTWQHNVYNFTTISFTFSHVIL